jgi:hypothetical protein
VVEPRSRLADGLKAQFRKGLRLGHILEFGHGADPIRRPYFHQSLFGAMSHCPLTVDRRSMAVHHLSRGAMATAPHSHTSVRLRDQAIECGNLRGGLCNAQRGSVHVHAEHDRESRSEARACQSMKVYFHSTSPLFLPGPNPLNHKGWVVTVAQFGSFSNAGRRLPCA